VKIIDTNIAPNEPRPSTQILHTDERVRLVAFNVSPGQSIPEHANPGTVILLVTEGSGIFHGADGSAASVSAGGMIMYAPGEKHAIGSDGGPVRFIAMILPRLEQ
jgi:quercetin dioxygenase-like cupin family protein